MRAWFPNNFVCLDYLDWLRWPDGFGCPHCSNVVVWPMGNTRLRCGGCCSWVSRTAGTIVQDNRVPLTSWFEVAWLMTVDKQGVSAASPQRLLSLGAYAGLLGVVLRDGDGVVRAGGEAHVHGGS